MEPIFSATEIADPEVEHLGVMAYAAYYTRLTPVKLKWVPATLVAHLDSAYVGREVGITPQKVILVCKVFVSFKGRHSSGDQASFSGMPIFLYFPFFPLFLARNLYVNVLYFLLFHLSLSELSVSFCVHFL